MKWPYPIECNQEERVKTDVLVIGGGISGCMAAISAAKQGAKVALLEKGATIRSGAGGSGCDHWESATTNPCSTVSPEEITQAMIDDNDGYNNGISHYIECREGWDCLREIEKMGGKIRDTEDEFLGADFRDPETKLMFAYDLKNKFTIRIWGSTFKPVLYKELKRLGVKIYDRIMVTSLLTEGGEIGKRVIGCTGFHVRTGKHLVVSSKATVLATSRPARIWLFSPAYPGLCEFRPTQCVGDGHAMGWRAGAAFSMMEKSVTAEFSAAGRSFPPYGTGNNHNTWYPASMCDARGKPIPYLDRDGKELKEFSDRYHPAAGQQYFLKGGSIDYPKYEYDGPETIDQKKLLSMGYKLPFYADLTTMPELERKAIWGMMVGEEGKTRVPIYQNYTERGFDPTRHVLQAYGGGWKSASFLPQERQLFGLPGGFLNDWNLATNLDGLFVAGDALFASNCFGHAAATGSYAGRHASAYAKNVQHLVPCEKQIAKERSRTYASLGAEGQERYSWKELNMAIAKTMQNYCGDPKCDDLLETGLDVFRHYETNILPHLYSRNPHELMRTLEVENILTNAQIILRSCLQRKSSSRALCFNRADYPEMDPERDRRFFTIRLTKSGVDMGSVPLGYYGDLSRNYEKYHENYIAE
jgi:succinate dehydrogenase/fumarate reductase flavoprotein subunit